MRLLGPAAAGLFASLLLVGNTVATRDRDLDRLVTPRRFWEDVTVAASCFARGEWPGSPTPRSVERLPTARKLAERAILDAVAAEKIRPWQPFRSVPPPRLVARERVTLRAGDDKGRALLLAGGFRLLGGIAPALGLWLGAFAAIPLLFWIGGELFAAGLPRAGFAFPLLLATCAYVFQVLSLPYSAVGFYTLAIVAVVPLSVYALLGRPTLRGLLLRSAVAGSLLALCALCRSGALLSLPGFALALALGVRRVEGRAPRARMLLFGLLLLGAPWLAVRPSEHRQPWMAFWQGLGDFDRSYGHTFYDPDAKQALVEAGVALRRDTGVEFENPENDRVFRRLFFASLRRDPAWYAGILLKRLGATLVQAPLWPGGRGQLRAAEPAPVREDVLAIYYRLTRTANWFGLGRLRVQVPVLLLLLPTLALVALATRRPALRPRAWLLAPVAVAALGLPVLVTTASALEPQAFMVVHFLALALLLDFRPQGSTPA